MNATYTQATPRLREKYPKPFYRRAREQRDRNVTEGAFELSHVKIARTRQRARKWRGLMSVKIDVCKGRRAGECSHSQWVQGTPPVHLSRNTVILCEARPVASRIQMNTEQGLLDPCWMSACNNERSQKSSSRVCGRWYRTSTRLRMG